MVPGCRVALGGGRPSGGTRLGGQGAGLPRTAIPDGLNVCPVLRVQSSGPCLWLGCGCSVARWQQRSCPWGCDPYKCPFLGGCGCWSGMCWTTPIAQVGGVGEGELCPMLQAGCFHPKLLTNRPREPHGGGALLPALWVSDQLPQDGVPRTALPRVAINRDSGPSSHVPAVSFLG